MGEVYQRALEVIAWIVPDPDQRESDAEEASDETADGPEHTLPLSRQQVKDVVLGTVIGRDSGSFKKYSWRSH